MRGGKREGSGRPASPEAKKPISVKLTPKVLAGIKALAESNPEATQAQVIDAALEAHLDLFLPGWREAK